MDPVEEAMARRLIDDYKKGTLTDSIAFAKLKHFFQILRENIGADAQPSKGDVPQEAAHQMMIPIGRAMPPSRMTVSDQKVKSQQLKPGPHPTRITSEVRKSPSPHRAHSTGFIPSVKKVTQSLKVGSVNKFPSPPVAPPEQSRPVAQNPKDLNNNAPYEGASQSASVPSSPRVTGPLNTSTQEGRGAQLESKSPKTLRALKKITIPHNENVARDQMGGARCPHDDQHVFMKYEMVNSPPLEKVGSKCSQPLKAKFVVSLQTDHKVENENRQSQVAPPEPLKLCPEPQSEKCPLDYFRKPEKEQVFITQTCSSRLPKYRYQPSRARLPSKTPASTRLNEKSSTVSARSSEENGAQVEKSSQTKTCVKRGRNPQLLERHSLPRASSFEAWSQNLATRASNSGTTKAETTLTPRTEPESRVESRRPQTRPVTARSRVPTLQVQSPSFDVEVPPLSSYSSTTPDKCLSPSRLSPLREIPSSVKGQEELLSPSKRRLKSKSSNQMAVGGTPTDPTQPVVVLLNPKAERRPRSQHRDSSNTKIKNLNKRAPAPQFYEHGSGNSTEGGTEENLVGATVRPTSPPSPSLRRYFKTKQHISWCLGK